LDRKTLTRKFVFDVDGTLTLSRKSIDKDFAEFFVKFCKTNLVYFVTGSDKPKTIEQIGEIVFNSAQLSFNCAGNEVWDKDNLIYSSDWKPEQEVFDYLEQLLAQSLFPHKAGNHIEIRKGMVNFSIAGRKCSFEQRELYKEWDKEYQERIYFRKKLKNQFKNIDVYIGGETGLDIFRKGFGKSQAISKIKSEPSDVIYYFGDQIFPGGNDYDAAILCDHYINVDSWLDTYHRLLTMSET
jgi:phosphomannomutase